MELIVNTITTVYSWLWGDLFVIPLPGGGSLGVSLLVLLLIPTGVFFTIRTRFLPIRLFPEMIRVTAEKRTNREGDAISGVQALIVSTATRVGMGNLIGVVAAISAGGAGAVFWMWITALIGSSTAFIEATLAQLHKEKDPLYGGWRGGPAYYIHNFVREKRGGKIGRYSVLAALFAGVALYLNANQVACGLALTIFGVGLSSFVGAAWVGKPLQGFAPLALPVLGELPLLGRMLFAQDALVYLSLALFAAVAWMLLRSRAGLVLQAVGENPDAASAMGLPVLRVRTLAVLFGGAMAGLAGAYLSLAYTPMWAENMTAGRGWIALALVVFASWRVFRVLLGAWLFGLASILHLVAQGIGLSIPANLLAMLPYAATILVLVLLSRDALRTRLYAPVSLGQPWKAGH